MEPLSDENNLQVDEKNNKKWKISKLLKLIYILNFKALQYKLTALSNLIQSIFNYKIMRSQSVLRLLKD